RLVQPIETLHLAFDFSDIPDMSSAIHQLDARRVAAGGRSGDNLQAAAPPLLRCRVAAVGKAGLFQVPPRGRAGGNRRERQGEAATTCAASRRHELDRRSAAALDEIVAAAVERKVANDVGGFPRAGVM